LIIELNPAGKDLTVELRPGKGCRVERLARGISLERDDSGAAVRLRFSGLDEPWLTNGFLTPLVACTIEGCAPVVGPDGSRHYDLAIGAAEKQQPFYYGAERPREPAGRRRRRNPFSEARERSEGHIDDLNALVMESFESNPGLRKKYALLYRAFREIAARRKSRNRALPKDS